ncbi:methyltransferase domain-containing protein [Ehrlichia ruminantium]|uniref:Methyltransferase domain-containing protein n=1 Tax=Ehrlichia ruminantium TaxID=779 RepID=A0AAE6Q8K4_EHRRU|nr:methyltransferase domain-containing protein [Ehrlichia ruminantium]QGR02111.1 methyltransferase domain-containing protein [Ehrlichia ruminantium]QGR03031.1 methyltransferase domain-containing protein [Ehrlichia ruminantium]QGR03956.1 methyltransferase domain-containing protein [Ehrlichia ruminantium]
MDYTTRKVQKAFDSAANSYDEFSWIQNIVLNKMCSLIKLEGGKNRILDIGCGTGNIGKLLNIAEHDFVQIDLSYEMCVLANKKNNKLSVNCNFDMMPFCANYFDIIIASMVLQWSCDINLSLLELIRVMKSGSTLYIAMPINGTLVELSTIIKKVGGIFNKFYSIDEVVGVVSLLGLKIQYLFCLSYKQYHKSFRAFLLNMKLTGVYAKKDNNNISYNIFDLGRIYSEMYSLGDYVFNSWNIMYLVIKK